MGGQVFSAVGQAHWLWHWQAVYRIAARPSPRVSGAVGRKLGTNAASAEKSVRAHSSSRHFFRFGVTVVLCTVVLYHRSKKKKQGDSLPAQSDCRKRESLSYPFLNTPK